MIHHQASSVPSMRLGRLSLLLGFTISLVPALAIAVLDRYGFVYQVQYGLWWQVVYLKMGMALQDILVRILWSLHHTVNWSPSLRVGMTSIPEIIGAFLTWGLFLSSMTYGYFCRKRSLSSGLAPNQYKWDRLRMITTATLILVAIVATTGSFLNEYRAHSVCGLGPFQPVKVAGEVVDMAIPLALIAVFYWPAKPGKVGDVITLLIGVASAAVCLHNLISDVNTSYAPCDRNGDKSSFNLYLFELLILFMWMVLYGITTFIESVRRRP
jgi:hypothetical protein